MVKTTDRSQDASPVWADPMLTPFEEELEVGTRFADRFSIMGVVGRGSMGIVYQARHELMGRTVAIKTLRGQLASDERSVRRFEREARAASRMDHPNLISVHDFGLTDNRQPYLVMDFAQGSTLYEIQRRENHLTPVRSVRIFTQVCDALQHAHLQGVIHRDLKPSNIMILEKDGEPDFVKVFDLGIAKIAWGEEEDKEPLTRTNEVCGSPIYLSPEQCKHEALDARSDIYSVGVVMYELLTGMPPLMGETVYDTIYMHVHEHPRPFSEIRPDLHIPSRMERIVFKALEKNPDDRYQSMQELKWELQASLQASDPHLQVLPPDAFMLKRKKTGPDTPVSQPVYSNEGKTPSPASGGTPSRPMAAARPSTPSRSVTPARPMQVHQPVEPVEEIEEAPSKRISVAQVAVISSVASVLITLGGVAVFFAGGHNKPAAAPTGVQQPPAQAVPATAQQATPTPNVVAQAPLAPVAPSFNPQQPVTTSRHKTPTASTPALRHFTLPPMPKSNPKHTKAGQHGTTAVTAQPAQQEQPGQQTGSNPFFSIFQGFPGNQQHPAAPGGQPQTAMQPAPQMVPQSGQTAGRQSYPQGYGQTPGGQPGYQAQVPPQQRPAANPNYPMQAVAQPWHGAPQGNPGWHVMPPAEHAVQQAPQQVPPNPQPRVQEQPDEQPATGPSAEAVDANNAGVGLMQTDPQTAIEHFRRALTLYPSYTRARQNMGRAWVNLGNSYLNKDNKAAMHSYKEAMAIFKSSGDTNGYRTAHEAYEMLARIGN